MPARELYLAPPGNAPTGRPVDEGLMGAGAVWRVGLACVASARVSALGSGVVAANGGGGMGLPRFKAASVPGSDVLLWYIRMCSILAQVL